MYYKDDSADKREKHTAKHSDLHSQLFRRYSELLRDDIGRGEAYYGICYYAYCLWAYRCTKVASGAQVQRSIIDENCRIREGALVGDGENLTVLGSDVQVEPEAKVKPGDWIAPKSVIAKGGE